MASVDRALVAPPKLRASILAHRRRQHFIFPRAAVPSDFHDFTSGALRPSIGEGGRYSVKTIFDVVSDISGFPLIAIRSQRRKRDLSWARQVAYWLCRQHTELSLPAIAKHFGGRDHTTIMSGCRVVERAIASEGIDVTDELHVMARRLLALGWASRARLARKAA